MGDALQEYQADIHTNAKMRHSGTTKRAAFNQPRAAGFAIK
jgi:hypothetical protein